MQLATVPCQIMQQMTSTMKKYGHIYVSKYVKRVCVTVWLCAETKRMKEMGTIFGGGWVDIFCRQLIATGDRKKFAEDQSSAWRGVERGWELLEVVVGTKENKGRKRKNCEGRFREDFCLHHIVYGIYIDVVVGTKERKGRKIKKWEGHFRDGFCLHHVYVRWKKGIYKVRFKGLLLVDGSLLQDRAARYRAFLVAYSLLFLFLKAVFFCFSNQIRNGGGLGINSQPVY